MVHLPRQQGLPLGGGAALGDVLQDGVEAGGPPGRGLGQDAVHLHMDEAAVLAHAARLDRGGLLPGRCRQEAPLIPCPVPGMHQVAEGHAAQQFGFRVAGNPAEPRIDVQQAEGPRIGLCHADDRAVEGGAELAFAVLQPGDTLLQLLRRGLEPRGEAPRLLHGLLLHRQPAVALRQRFPQGRILLGQGRPQFLDLPPEHGAFGRCVGRQHLSEADPEPIPFRRMARRTRQFVPSPLPSRNVAFLGSFHGLSIRCQHGNLKPGGPVGGHAAGGGGGASPPPLRHAILPQQGDGGSA